ncbi:hypothetical protein B4113_1031 [Geobacillus sp. B4113_201601]|nr:hypothetical protein B4113_1031 [Geobacillus sp. B4113_201601]
MLVSVIVILCLMVKEKRRPATLSAVFAQRDGGGDHCLTEGW